MLAALRWLAIATVVATAAGFVWLEWPAPLERLPAGVSSAAPGMADRGAYLVRAAACLPCHWDKKNGGQRFAGGRQIKTQFGTFYTPNISPDDETGIGKWSDAEFVRALKHGVGRSGEQLYPTFPYTSYRFMKVEDVLAIKAYLMTQNAVHSPDKRHALRFPYSWRALVKIWKLQHGVEPQSLADDPAQSAAWNRGRYLVTAVGHCAECHSPRDAQGVTVATAWLQGNPHGPDGWKVPALAGPRAKDFAGWSRDQIADYLESGSKPDFDQAQGPMAEVITEGTKYLTAEDRLAIADYLRSLSTPH
ncbi:MAG: c-type cytochrome [Alphaproteobacteria bacterium]|nr:c-type cytochrome [Alphaproteobacteria bacterium]